MDKVQIDALVHDWAWLRLDVWEERVVGPSRSAKRWESIEEDFNVELDATREALMGNKYQMARDEVNELLQSNDLPMLDHGSVEYKRLARAFLMANQEVLKIEMERWNEDYPRYPPAVVNWWSGCGGGSGCSTSFACRPCYNETLL